MAKKTKKDTKNVKDKKEQDATDKVTGIGPHLSTIYTLTDEAMRSHRERDYGNMFNCILALQNLLRSVASIKTINEPHKELFEFINHKPIVDSKDNTVYLSIYTLMRAARYNYCGREDYVQEVVDVDGNQVFIPISNLLKTYEYIGQKLMDIMFCLLFAHQIDLPKEMYITHNMPDDG